MGGHERATRRGLALEQPAHVGLDAARRAGGRGLARAQLGWKPELGGRGVERIERVGERRGVEGRAAGRHEALERAP